MRADQQFSGLRYGHSKVSVGSNPKFILGISDPVVAAEVFRRNIMHRIEAGIYREEQRIACKVLMKDGKWLVPENERPVLPPAPIERRRRK